MAYHLVRPQTPPEIEAGLSCLMGGPETVDPVAAQQRAEHLREALPNFLNYAREIGLDPGHQVQCFVSGENELTPDQNLSYPGKLTSVCLWVPSPGHVGMIFTPSVTEYPFIADATRECVIEALADAGKFGLTFLQAVLNPEDLAGRDVLLAAGMQVLAVLEYMERKVPLLPPQQPNLTSAQISGHQLTIENYTPENHTQFAATIEASYQGTLDCPALAGMRQIEDIIAGHKGVGEFDPSLWFLIKEDGNPLGCLLLAFIPARQTLDLVYLGLTPAARGRGLGRVLMQQLLWESYNRKCLLLSVSADESNIPAHKLYHRFGYTTQARRLTLIAAPAKPH